MLSPGELGIRIVRSPGVRAEPWLESLVLVEVGLTVVVKEPLEICAEEGICLHLQKSSESGISLVMLRYGRWPFELPSRPPLCLP